jgi:hypothetical protein
MQEMPHKKIAVIFFSIIKTDNINQRRYIMPGFAGTGPRGQGAMTGGGRGNCVTNIAGNGVRAFGGRGRGFYGRSGGRGCRNIFYATGVPGWARANGAVPYGQNASKDEKLAMLKGQAADLKGELDAVLTRLSELESKDEQ